VATQLYRIAQEAITNAVKHAHARSITTRIDGEAGAVALHIVDDGLGIDQAEASDGMGLRIMRYRASSIGGRLSVGRGADGGTLVICTVRQVPHGGTTS
jgi:signal transduction histidine kinase